MAPREPGTPDPSDLTPRERVYVPLAAAAAAALTFLSEPSFFRGTDYVNDWLPKQEYLRARLLHGELPLWTPYVGLGRPFLAAIDTGSLYPPNLVSVALGTSGGSLVLTLAHFMLAAVFTIKLGAALGLARPLRWLAALAFLFSTLMFVHVHVGPVHYAWGVCLLPVAFWLGLRLQDHFSARGLAGLALTLGLQLLCGVPQIAWITWFSLGSFLLGRAWGGAPRDGLRRAGAGLGGMAVALAWGFALAAVQLLPLFTLIAQSNRARPTVAAAAEGSFDWHLWLSLVVPADGVSPLPILSSIFVGAPIVLAGLCGLALFEDRNARGLGLATLMAALLVAGTHTPAFRILYSVVPGLSSFHFHGRTAIVLMLTLALAGGLFLSQERVSPRALAVLAASTAAWLLAVWWYVRALPAAARPALWLPHRLAAVAAAGALIAIWHTRRAPRARAWSLAALALLAVAELAGSIVAIKRVGVLPGPFPGEAHVAALLRQSGLPDASGTPPRVAVPYPLIRDNSGASRGYGSISGYVPLALGRVWAYEHEALGLPYPEGQNEFPSRELYGHGPFPYPSMNIALGWDPADGALRLNPSPDPRAYVVGAARVVADWHQAMRALAAGHDFHREALVEVEAPLQAPLGGGGGAARITHFAPESIEVETTSAGAGLMVLAEPWYPGWSARVDGAPAPCLPANGWMRAVPVPAGKSRVELRYRENRLAAGAAVSLAAAALLAAVALRAGRTSASSP